MIHEQPVSQKESKIKIPPNTPEEIKEALLESRKNLSITVKIQDDKIFANFHYSTDDDYADFDRTFNSWKEFNGFADKFFSLQEL